MDTIGELERMFLVDKAKLLQITHRFHDELCKGRWSCITWVEMATDLCAGLTVEGGDIVCYISTIKNGTVTGLTASAANEPNMGCGVPYWRGARDISRY